LTAQQALVAATRKSYRLSRLRFQEGVDSYLAVLDSQRELYGAQQALIQTRLADFVSRIDLYRALGGGWREHTAPDQAAAAQSLTASRATSR
jgi:multidrug efflux system outer membrane protein